MAKVKPAGGTAEEPWPREPSSALEMLMSEYGTMVLRTAYFYMRDRHLAEDISQEVFIRAYRNWLKFRGDSSVKTWLTRITINLCKDKLRLKASAEEPTDPALLQSGAQESVEDGVLRRLRNTTLLKQVFSLPAHYREVVYLYYYLDLSTMEIAEAADLPEGTVRGRLHRARKLLGERMKREGADL